MPEIRYVETYKDGKLVDKEPYEVSDEQLERESAEKDLSELFFLADDQITVPKIGKFLKALAKLK